MAATPAANWAPVQLVNTETAIKKSTVAAGIAGDFDLRDLTGR